MTLSRTILILGLLFLISGCASTTSHGTDGRALTLLRPKDQSLSRGGTNKVLVTVERDGFSGPIAIEFEDLPDGVRVIEEDPQVPADDYFQNFTFYVEDNAPVVSDHSIRIIATGPNGLEAVEHFQVDIS
ncbi:MAG: hypothetical protein RL885_32390 [Planctomycetota bacterium]